MSKHLWAFGLVAVALSALVAVSTAGGARKAKGVSGKISVMAVWTGEEQKSFQAVLDGFKAANPDVSVTYTSAGDQLPTVRDVVEQLVINSNTVLKAYRELEHEGLVSSRPGQGTFVLRTLAAVSLASHATLRRSLVRWLQSAREAGLDDESILAIFNTTFWDVRAAESEGTA